MDTRTLVVNSPDIESGKKFVELLDMAGVDVGAAFWLLREESEEWRLYIATPLASTIGPLDAYTKVLHELARANVGIPSINLSVIDPADPLVRLLSLAIHTDNGVSGISFSRNTING